MEMVWRRCGDVYSAQRPLESAVKKHTASEDTKVLTWKGRVLCVVCVCVCVCCVHVHARAREREREREKSMRECTAVYRALEWERVRLGAAAAPLHRRGARFFRDIFKPEFDDR